MAKTTWKISGEKVAVCNCAWGCPCQFNALPTKGRCETVAGISVRQGSYGNTKLDGLRFAFAIWFPGAMHKGDGISQIAIDGRATPDQFNAIVNIVTGKDGGMPFEIFASVTKTFLEPVFAPVEFDVDRPKRVARLNVPGFGEFRTESIKNPVTGEDHRALIKLPNGFEYKEAEMGNAVMMKATVGDKTLDNENSYAALAAVEWSNEPSKLGPYYS